MSIRRADCFFLSSKIIRTAWREGWDYFLNSHPPAGTLTAHDLELGLEANTTPLYARYCEMFLAPAMNVLNHKHSQNPVFKGMDMTKSEREIMAGLFLLGPALGAMPYDRQVALFGDVLPAVGAEIMRIDCYDEWPYMNLSKIAACVMRLNESLQKPLAMGGWISARRQAKEQVIFSAKIPARLQAMMDLACKPLVLN